MSSNCCNNSSCTPTRVSLDYSGGEPLTYDTQTVEELVQYLKEGSVRGVDCVKSTGTGSNKLEDIDVKNWADGSYAVALGYSIKGDGRGGLFRLDKSGALGVGAQNDKDIFLAKGALDWYWLQIYNWTNKGIDCIVSTGTGDFKLESLDVKNFPHGFTQSVLGYHAAGDGGGGVFWLDKSGTLGAGAANGVTIFNALGGVNWYWRRSLEGSELLVEMGGAKGDGVTNDSAAISAVFALADTVDIGDKTYLIDTNLTLPANKTLRSKGGILSVGVGITLTVNAAVECEHVQLFSGAGTVIFGISYRGNTKVAWFGDIYTDAGDSLNKWHAAVNSTASVKRFSRKGILPAGNLPMLTPAVLDYVPPGSNDSGQVWLEGQGGIMWDWESPAADELASYTVLDASGLGSGEDALQIGEFSTPGDETTFCRGQIIYRLKGFCVRGAPRDGIRLLVSGARGNVNEVGAYQNGRHGFVIYDAYGSTFPHIVAEGNGGCGVLGIGLNTVDFGMVITRHNGSASNQNGAPFYYGFDIGYLTARAGVTGGSNALSVANLYTERNWSGAARFKTSQVNIGASYSEVNNAPWPGPDLTRQAPGVWHIIQENIGIASMCRVNIGQLNIGAESGDVVNPIILIEGDGNSYTASLVCGALQGSGSKLVKLVSNAQLHVIGEANGLNVDVTECDGINGFVNTPGTRAGGYTFTTADEKQPKLVWDGGRRNDQYEDVVTVTANYIMRGHERLIRVDASAGSINIDIRRVCEHRDGDFEIIRLDGTSNIVTVTDGNGYPVRGKRQLLGVGSAAIYRFLWDRIDFLNNVPFWYGYATSPDVPEGFEKMVVVPVASSAILTLNVTPVTLVAAQGSGKAIWPRRGVFRMNYNSAAYTGANNIELRYTDGAGTKLFEDIPFSELNNAGDISFEFLGRRGITPVANAPLVAVVPNANPATGNSDTQLQIEYEVVAV